MPDPMRSAPRLDPADRPCEAKTRRLDQLDPHPWSDGRPRDWNRHDPIRTTEETTR